MGAPRKPMAVREIHGTANRNKQRNNPNEPVPTKGIGPAPDHFDESLSAIWDEYVSIIYAGVFGEADRIALEVACRLTHLMRVDFEGMTAAQLSQLNNILSKFGMTPSDRSKVSVPKDKPKSAFEGM